MRKIVLYISIFIAICIIVGIAYSFYRYYAPPKLRQPYQINATPDDTLRIAFIGDSWAFLHQRHRCLIPSLIERNINRPAKVYSCGFCGLTSKEIYENLYEDIDLIHFFQNRCYQYCIISAGINDANKKMSINYYQKSINGIFKFLIANNIHPIIIEIPNYDIEKLYRWESPVRKLLRHISIIINGIPLDCRQNIRNGLNDLIEKKYFNEDISVIRYKAWNNHNKHDLVHLYLSDGIHLNAKGYAKLDSTIANKILELTIHKSSK